MQLDAILAPSDNQLARSLLRKAKDEGLTNSNQLAVIIGVDQESLDRVLTTPARPNARTRERYEAYLQSTASSRRRTHDHPTTAQHSSASPLERKPGARRPPNASVVVPATFDGMTQSIDQVREAIIGLSALLPILDSLKSQLGSIEHDPLVQEVIAAPQETRAALHILIRKQVTGRIQRKTPSAAPVRRPATAPTSAPRPGTASRSVDRSKPRKGKGLGHRVKS